MVLANGSELPDCIVIDFFSDGLNQLLKSVTNGDPRDSVLSNFLDYALWTVGSAFTVGVAEECDIASALVMCAYKMAVTTKPRHDTAVVPEASHVTAARTKPCHEPINPLTSQLSFQSLAMSCLIFQSHTMSQLIFQSLVT